MAKTKLPMKRKKVIAIINNLSYLNLACLPTLMWTFNHIDRYIHWALFFILLLFSGTVLGYTAFKIVTRNNPELAKHKNKKKVSLLHIFVALGVILTPFFGLIINENIGVISHERNYVVHQVSQSGGGLKNTTRANYILIINDNNQIERLQFGKAFITHRASQGSVFLNYNIGLLGFAYYSIPQRKIKEQ